MCGIVGIFNRQPNQSLDEATLIKARDLITYRGPDDAGVYVSPDQRIGLAHRRLSIIDLSSAGHQQMSNEDSTIWIVYNGETYNYLEIKPELEKLGHKFKSNTDTEVIIHAYEQWGEDCVKKFNGMWSFVIWDSKREKVFCSCGRFGVKPFYYFLNNDVFIFASEVKAILSFSQVPRQLNEPKIFEYLAYALLDTNEQTFFKNIFQLRGGHNLVIERNSIRLYRYWDLPRESTKLNYPEACEKFRYLLGDAVRLRFRSDVPVAVLLSGGLDSSAIACLAAKEMSNVEVFSAQYPGQACDETHYIEMVLKKYPQLKAHSILPDSQNFKDEIEQIVWHQGEPHSSVAVLSHWLLMKEISRTGIKVILSGQGADELLAGYYDSFGYYLARLLQRGQFNKFRQELNLLSSHYQMSRKHLLANLIKAEFPRKMANPLRVITQDKILEWLRPSFIMKYLGGTVYQKKFNNILTNCLWRQIDTDTLPQILHYEDRNSMAFSVEERVPFLDYRLVEFVFSLPDEYKINNGLTKLILRDSLRGIVPEEILQRTTKIGFSTPIDKWLSHNMSMVERATSRLSSFYQPYFKAEQVKKMIEPSLRGSIRQAQIIWRIVNLDLWFDEYFIP